jgi:bile acid acyltransferase/acyl-CoA thioester hydrolase-like protein
VSSFSLPRSHARLSCDWHAARRTDPHTGRSSSSYKRTAGALRRLAVSQVQSSRCVGSPGALLASHGFAALVVGYFGIPGRPRTLCEVPLESLAAGVERLRGHEAVDRRGVAALGTSVGAEAVLAMASYIDGLELAAVVGVAPSSVVWQALGDGRPPDKPRWTLGGRPSTTRA